MAAMLRSSSLISRLTSELRPLSSSIHAQKRCLSDHPLTRRGNSEANVVIIGGGAVGTSVLYHLAKQGMKDVVLLEKTELTAGSTWHAAGLATNFQSVVNLKPYHSYGMKLYPKLEEETGQEINLHYPGSIRLLGKRDRMDEAKYAMSRQRWNEVEARILSPEEVKEMCPIISTDGLLGGLFTPDDGHVDPYSLTMAYAAGAKMHGGEIYQHAPMTAARQRKDNKWEIETPHGTLVAKHLLNAAGFHGHEINQMLGINIPLVPVHHQFLITRPLPEIIALEKEIPVLRDLDGSFYVRQERQGLIIGPYEGFDAMRLCEDWVRNGVPPDFGKQLFEPDLERMMPHVEIAMERLPPLKEAEIQTIIAGPITYSPENIPLLGPFHGYRNLWLAVGFGYGIAHSGGLGKYMADYIIDGEPPSELIDVDANRYGKWWTIDFALIKARETYSLNNYVGFPKEERFYGRPTGRNSKLYEILKKRGAEFGFHSGWEQPHWFSRSPEESGYKPSFRRTNWFSALKRECAQIMERVGVIDLTPFAKIEVTGPDASKFLDYVTANSLPKLRQARVTHMLTPKGKVFAELTISRLEENRYMVVTGSGSEFHDLIWMEKHSDDFDVSFNNITDDVGVLGVAGPLSRDVLTSITDIDLSNKAFKFMDVKSCNIGGVNCTAIRISFTGELGWELYCKLDDIGSLYEAILKAGQSHGIDDVGGFAVNALRSEKGFRVWGNEMKCNNNPIEAGLGFFIKTDKETDFIGKEAIRQIKKEGIKEQVVMLKVDAPEVDPEGYESVWNGNKVIGHTTSGTWSPVLNSSLAFAYIPVDMSAPGTQLSVELLGNMCKAEVLPGQPSLTEPTRTRLAAKRLKEQEALKQRQ